MTTFSRDVKPTDATSLQLGASSQTGHYTNCEVSSPQDDLDIKTQIQSNNESQGGGATSSDDGSFDCNICLELAQDPVVTLCGHLFCWPCLYRWLQVHSLSQECPVCKANVEEEMVIPLYGRGKVGSVDPRTKAVLGINIPHRPAGQRPDMSRQNVDHMHPYHPLGYNYMTGLGGPNASTRFGDITLSAGFGLFPSLFGFHIHGIQDGAGIHGQGISGGLYPPPAMAPDQQQEAQLSRILLLLGCLVILCLLFF